MSKHLSVALALAVIAGPAFVHAEMEGRRRNRNANLIDPEDYEPTAPAEKKGMPMTEDELKELASLFGKDKKNFLKKMREKYEK